MTQPKEQMPEDMVAPKTPTREMLLRGFDALDCTFSTFEERLINIAAIYAAMTEDCADLVEKMKEL